MSGILGIKVGMSQVFTKEGKCVPVTLVNYEGCVVVQKKTQDKGGYNAIQLGIGKKSPKKLSKAVKKHFEKAKLKPTRWLREFRVEDVEKFEVGKPLPIEFKAGDMLDVRGTTKGRGFAGVMKRWGFKGGPGGHGSTFHRHGGSIGNATQPAKVFKGTKMPGHYGVDKTVMENIECIDVLKDDHLVVLKGSLPGSKNSLVELRMSKRAK
jgi:large subunit ribosomal protein L3